MRSTRELLDTLADLGVKVIRFKRVDACTTTAYIEWTREVGERIHTALRGVNHHVVQLSENYGQVTVRAAHVAQVRFAMESAIGRPVTVFVPHSVHYSGNRTGTVVALATVSGQPDGPTYLVLDTGCGHVLIPLDAVMSWESAGEPAAAGGE